MIYLLCELVVTAQLPMHAFGLHKGSWRLFWRRIRRLRSDADAETLY